MDNKIEQILSSISSHLEVISEELTSLRRIQDRQELRENEKFENLRKIQTEAQEADMEEAYRNYNGLSSRINEIWGDGLSIDDMIARKKERDASTES